MPVLVARRLLLNHRFSVQVACERGGIENVAASELSVGLTTAPAGDANPSVTSATATRTTAPARRVGTRRRAEVLEFPSTR